MLSINKPTDLWLMHNKSQGLMRLKTATILDGKPQHIYIISDKGIKEGDWALNIEENTIFKPSNDEIYDIKNSEAKYYEYCKKIILTTDQDLIADGIEQISEDTLLKIIEHINSGKNIESFGEL